MRGAMPLWVALAPVVLLVTLLGADVVYFGEDSSYGSNQIALLLAALFAGALGMGRGTTWTEIRDAIAHSIGTATEAILIHGIRSCHTLGGKTNNVESASNIDRKRPIKRILRVWSLLPKCFDGVQDPSTVHDSIDRLIKCGLSKIKCRSH